MEGTMEAEWNNAKIVLRRLGPGTVFAAFGMFIIVSRLYAPITVNDGDGGTIIGRARPPVSEDVVPTAAEERRVNERLLELNELIQQRYKNMLGELLDEEMVTGVFFQLPDRDGEATHTLEPIDSPTDTETATDTPTVRNVPDVPSP